MQTPSSAPRSTGMRIATELGGIVVMSALGVIALAHLANTPRSWLLFEDGDSVVLALMRRAAEVGQTVHWSYSPVLFIPEKVLYQGLGLLGLPPQAVLAVNAVANLVLFGFCARFLLAPALARRDVLVRITSGVAATATLTAFVLLESSPSRSSVELASLHLLTTYYSATAWSMLLVLGFTTRLLGACSAGRRAGLLAVLGGVTTVSVLTNPLMVAWGVVPVVLMTALTAPGRWSARSIVVGSRHRTIGHDLSLVGTVLGGTGLGLLARLPADTSGSNKIRPEAVGRALEVYGAALVERLSSVPGALEVTAWCAVWATVVIACVRALARTRGRAPVDPVLLIAAVMPVATVVGAILLGTWATRYLQPVLLLPAAVCPVIVLRATRRRRPRPVRPVTRTPRHAAVVAIVVVVSAAVAATPGAVASATTVDRDVACVVRWADRVGRVGAGDFWSVRGVKYRLAHPAQLLQVGPTQRIRPWLSNRRDADGVRAVSWMLFGPGGTEWRPDRIRTSDPGARPIARRCGAFTIVDWGRAVVPVVGGERDRRPD